MPALAQRIVDDTNLPIYGGTLMAVSDDSVRIGLNTALSVPGGLSVGLDALELWLYNKDTDGFKPWSMVPLDKRTVSGRTEINVENQLVGVGDRDELHTWLSGMLYNDTAEISARGNTTAHLGALNFDISLDKTVTIDALRELEGFSLASSQLLLPPRDDGINIVGNMTLPNWSILTIGLGNLTFNAWAGERLIGNVAVFDVVLEPGNTTLPFEGELYLNTVFENIVEILGTQSSALGSGALEVGISGNSTKVDGEHITYLENVLNEAHILSQVPIAQLLTDVLASVRDGGISLDGLLDVVSDAAGPLLDDLLGGFGGGGDDGEGGDGEDGDSGRVPVDDILGDLLDNLDDNTGGEGGDEGGGGGEDGGDGGEDGDDILGNLLDGLGMRNVVARTKLSNAWRRLKR